MGNVNWYSDQCYYKIGILETKRFWNFLSIIIIMINIT